MNSKSNLNIGFLTASNPKDKNSWSGTMYRMYDALTNEFDNVEPIGPIPRPKYIGALVARFDMLLLKVFDKKYDRQHNVLKSIYYRSYLKDKTDGYDVLFVPASFNLLAFIKTKAKIITFDDITYTQLIDYYNAYSNLSWLSIKESEYIIKKAFKKTSYNIYSSDWAAKSAIENYNRSEENVSVINLGANLELEPKRDDVIRKDFSNSINLLFLGRDWKRKGGDIAFEAFKIINDRNKNVKFIVCGCKPPTEHPNMEVIDLLDKNNPEELAELNNILIRSHVLFVPTRADCTPIVFCEAFAYGIPVITADTGGVTSLIENDKNGYALPLESTPEDYAKYILELIDDSERMKRFSLYGRKKYEEVLNWTNWAKRVKEIIEKV